MADMYCDRCGERMGAATHGWYCQCGRFIPLPSEPASQPEPQSLEKAIRDILDLYSASYLPDKLLDEVTQEIMQAIAASQQAETQAMREALHRIYELIDINLPYCDRCDDIRDIVMKFEGGR